MQPRSQAGVGEGLGMWISLMLNNSHETQSVSFYGSEIAHTSVAFVIWNMEVHCMLANYDNANQNF